MNAFALSQWKICISSGRLPLERPLKAGRRPQCRRGLWWDAELQTTLTISYAICSDTMSAKSLNPRPIQAVELYIHYQPLLLVLEDLIAVMAKRVNGT